MTVPAPEIALPARIDTLGAAPTTVMGAGRLTQVAVLTRHRDGAGESRDR